MKLFLILLITTVVKSDIPYVNFQLYENFSIPTLKTVCSSFENASLSQTCRDQLEVVCDNGTLFFQIFDASAKFPYPGLSYSTRIGFGNFDQCLSIDQTYSGGRILGEYCTYGFVIPDLNDIENQDKAFALAVCRPNGCHASDYNRIVNYLLFQTDNSTGLFVDGYCQTVDSASNYTVGDIVVLNIFGDIIFLMVISTLYDIYLERTGRKSAHPLCLAFSVLSNGRKLLHITRHPNSKEQIEVFHGIRVISMVWIVAGHVYSTWQFGFLTNTEDVAAWPLKFSSFHMTAAPLSVDTFFFMSGFLLAFQYFKGRTKTFKDQVFSIPRMIVHRYLRLTPATLMLYLVTITIFVHLGSGPFYSIMFELFKNTCETYWWRYFLYIQNYYDFNDMCLMQTWYLSADMQLFLISPLILIPLFLLLKNFGFKTSIVGLLILNVIWTILPMVIKIATTYKNEYDTHSRLIDYFIGVMLGFFMRVRIDKPFLYMVDAGLKSTINLVTWLVVILGMLAVVLCYQDQSLHYGYVSIQVFQSLMRPAWCIGLSWITYSCYHGQGGFVNWILCRPSFQVLGRLTYCIYLLHISVVLYFIGSARDKWFFSEYNVFYQVCGHYVVTVIVAIFWTLAFESPLIIIEKYLLGSARPAKKEQQTNGGIEESSRENVAQG